MNTPELLSWLWRASWQASVLVVLVLLAQWLFRAHLPPRWRYALWFLVVIRLLLPVMPESSLSIFNYARVDRVAAPVEEVDLAFMENKATPPFDETAWEVAAWTEISAAAEAAGADGATPAPAIGAGAGVVTAESSASVPPPNTFGFLMFGLWLAGALLLLLRLIWGNARFAWRLRDLAPVGDPDVLALFDGCRKEMGVRRSLAILETADVESPALFGLVRLQLLLPAAMLQRFSHQELRYVFLHELAHVRRGDVVMNWLVTVLHVLHWFNPVLWFGFRRMRADRELACDALALSRTKEGENRGYGQTILKLLEGFHRPIAVTGLVGIIENKGQMKQRMRMIAQFRSRRNWSLLALVLLGGLALGGLTDAMSEDAAEIDPEPAAIDLKPFYDLNAADMSQFGKWEVVPKGRQIFDGVPFDVSGMIRLFGLIPPPQGTIYREEVAGIPVGRTFEQLHLLHGTGWTTEDGVVIARVVLRYADGSEAGFPIVYGQHVRDWWHRERSAPSEVSDPDSDVSWVGEHNGTGLRFYRSSFANPHPEKEVATIDLVSEKSPVTPAIISLSVGPPAQHDDSSSATFSTGTVQQRDEASPTARGERQTLRLRVVNEHTGEPLPATGLQVNYCDDRGCFYLGSFQTDERGEKAFSYPVEKLTSLTIGVVQPGFVGKHLTWDVESGEAIPETFTVSLDRGVEIGGLVRDTSGRPVADATIELALYTERTDGVVSSRISKRASLVTTDTEGKWTAAGVPDSYAELKIDVSHPEFAPLTVSTDENPHRSTDWASVSVAALGEQTAAIVLEPGASMRGRVVDENGTPVSSARVTLGESVYDGNKQTALTEEDGSFVFRLSETSSSQIFVVRDGFSPAIEEVDIGAEAADVEIILEKGRVLTGRVVDVEGNPIAGVLIAPEEWKGHRIFEWRGRTDEEGRFTWDSAPDGLVEFSILKSGYLGLRNRGLLVDGEEKVITMELAPRIAGRVTDAATGEPVKAFRVLLGEAYGGPEIYWREAALLDGDAGEFILTHDEPFRGEAVLRIEADGYLPALSDRFSFGSANDPFAFALEAGEPLAGSIVGPDGTAAAGADVAFLPADSFINLGRGALDRRYSTDPRPMRMTQSDENGNFSLPPDPTATSIVFVHESGYVKLSIDEARDTELVKLEPWGRVEGVVRIGAEAGTNEKVRLTPPVARELSYDHDLSEVTADEQGEFSFDYVPPGMHAVHRLVPVGDSRRMYSHRTFVQVLAGETARVQIGGEGRPVTGRIAWDVSDQRADWKVGHGILATELPDRPVGMENEEWNRSEEWKRAREQQKRYGIAIRPDGTFRVDDVVAGNYELSLALFEEGEGHHGERIAWVNTKIAVPPVASGRSEEAYDVGELDMVLAKNLKPGDTVPSVAFSTLDGRQLKLSDFRGKYVLLDFWATWCGPCVKETPYVKEAYEMFRTDERFEIVSLSLDPNQEAPRKYVEENELDWVQGFLGKWSETSVPDEFGVQGIPAFFLIGPDGKLVAKGMRGQRIKAAVAEVLR